MLPDGRDLRWTPTSVSIVFVAVAAVIPSLIWIGVDKTVWPWDQAWYGKYSVELFFNLTDSPSTWPRSMLNVLGRQAPGIVWFGQFFVPLGRAIGSIDAGLLLSIVLAQVAALTLTSMAVWQLSDGRFRTAATGMAVMASAPLTIALSHYYAVEMMQTASVAWFILIMARAPGWSRWTTAAQLLAATSVAMLAKASSPLYCVGPGLAILSTLIRPGARAQPHHQALVAAGVFGALLLATVTVWWYSLNLHLVLAHIESASSGRVAELYGKQDVFLSSLTYWLSTLLNDFFSPVGLLAAAGSLLAAIAAVLTGRARVRSRLALAVAVSVFEIALVLSVFSLNANREDRYLLPLLPYVGLILCWSVQCADRRLVTAAVVGAFLFQWADIHAQSFGLVKPGRNVPAWLEASDTNAATSVVLNALVDRTCAASTPGFTWNALGVQLKSLNPPALSYAAAKALAPRRALNCDFDAIGYYESDADAAWSRLVARKIVYYIAVDPQVYQIPDTELDLTVNQLNEPILKRIEASGIFQRQSMPPELPGIRIFKRVDFADHLDLGRSLLGRGEHDQAVEELRRATALDPGNVEAWANLAVAYERQGDFEQAIAAGLHARDLDARHYYVHLGLARAFAQLKQWSRAANSAEDAARDALDVPARVSALTLAGRNHLQAGDSQAGCDALRSAAALQSTPELQGELASRGCGK